MVLTHVKKMQLVITPLVGTTAHVILVLMEMETIALVSVYLYPSSQFVISTQNLTFLKMD